MKTYALGTLFMLAASTQMAEAGALLERDYRPLAVQHSVHLQDEYGGKVLLIVNTASKCGFTPQYEGLEALHQELSGQGFAVLGFPSNDFRGQEPGSEEEIQEFCSLTYGVEFPMFQKVQVIGENATPLYQDLSRITGVAPGWNFHKYLISRNGEVVAQFPSRVKPDDAELRAAIERKLAVSINTID